MEITKKEKICLVLDALYLSQLSANPLKDREEIKKHCLSVASSKDAERFGDPHLFDIAAIDDYLSKEHLPSSFRATYKKETLTAWDKLILASKKFVSDYFYDMSIARQGNIQLYKSVTKKLTDDYGLNPTTKEGKQDFLKVLEQELAVRINWFLKKDQEHSTASITALAILYQPSLRRKFFLNVLLAERKNIYSYLNSDTRSSISSMYGCTCEIPDMGKVRNVINFLENYSQGLLKNDLKTVISSITGMQGKQGTPQLDALKDFLDKVKEGCEIQLDIRDASQIVKILSSITGMHCGQGLPDSNKLEEFFKTIKECYETLGITDLIDKIRLIKSIAGMQNQHGLPDPDNLKAFCTDIKKYCKAKLNTDDPKKTVEFLRSVSGMQNRCGIPEINGLKVFLKTIDKYFKKKLGIHDPLKIRVITRSLMGMLGKHGIPETRKLKNFLKTIQTHCQDELNIKDPFLIARVIRSFAWMMSGYGLPDSAKAKSFLQTVQEYCKAKLQIENQQMIIDTIRHISWMQFSRGMPDPRRLEAFFNTLRECTKNELDITKELGLKRLLRFLGKNRKGQQIVDSLAELTKLFKKTGKGLTSFGLSKNKYEDITANEILRFSLGDRVSDIDREQLNERLFRKLDEHLLFLKKYSATLQSIWGLPSKIPYKLGREQDNYKKKIFDNALIRFYATKVKENPDAIRECHRIAEKTREKIIEIANQYLICRKAIIQINDGLVFHYLANYQNESLSDQHKVDDLLQIGRIGLINGIDRFLPERGFTFSHHATLYIRGEISKSFKSGSGIVKHSASTGEIVKKLKERLNRQKVSSSNENIDELAEELGIQTKTAERLLSIPETSVSISSSTLGGARLLEDNHATPAEEAEAEEIQSKKRHFAETVLPTLMEDLSEIERRVITEYFGLFNNRQQKTNSEIAKILNPDKPLSPQRMGQIREAALLKIRERINTRPEIINEIKTLYYDE